MTIMLCTIKLKKSIACIVFFLVRWNGPIVIPLQKISLHNPRHQLQIQNNRTRDSQYSLQKKTLPIFRATFVLACTVHHEVLKY
jgi:hypothetical protein